MKQVWVCLMVAAFLLAPGMSCTKKEGEEKIGIEAMTEQAGREATEAIKGPINKARGVEALSRERVEEMNAVEDVE